MSSIKAPVPMMLIALLSGAGISLQAEDRMKAGLWQNTVVSGGKTAVQTACISAEQAQSNNLPAPAMRLELEKTITRSSKGTCSLKSFNVEGDKLSRVMVCGPVSISTVTTFHGDTFETTSTTTKTGVERVTLMKGRRMGACPAENRAKP